ncbi:hypothetical protein [Mycolicibacterium fortuitum]|nr:hypothetical protein [Mycolicibacterium fortuitum]
MTVNNHTATDFDESAVRPDYVETVSAAMSSDGADADGGDADDSTDECSETGSETAKSEDPKTDREAAKYRRQLRDTEAERDRLLTQVEGYHRAEV